MLRGTASRAGLVRNVHQHVVDYFRVLLEVSQQCSSHPLDVRLWLQHRPDFDVGYTVPLGTHSYINVRQLGGCWHPQLS